VDVRACSGLRLMAWPSVSDDGAILTASFSFATKWWWCSVLFVWCTLRCVMYECFFFLYDKAVLLLLFK
jgi:hypothetical protein